MATTLHTFEEYQKIQAKNQQALIGPRWFMLSYDAGAEIREERMNESSKWVSYVVGHSHTTDDFRKNIIRTLRIAEVEEMDEPVETTILFKDPRTNMSIVDKLNYWKKLFDTYGDEFKYVLVATIQLEGKPYRKDNPNSVLQKSFQKLLKEVKDAELKIKK
jgi:hypothetical protein